MELETSKKNYVELKTVGGIMEVCYEAQIGRAYYRFGCLHTAHNQIRRDNDIGTKILFY